MSSPNTKSEVGGKPASESRVAASESRVAGVERIEPPKSTQLGARCARPQPPSSSSWSLYRHDTSDLLLDSVEIAASFASRLIGLQFRRSLPRGHALLLVPCSSVHTMCVRFPIDVYFLSTTAEVLEVHRNVLPWRFAIPRVKAHAVLETNVGGLDADVGTKLCLKSVSADDMPTAAAFLFEQPGDAHATP